MHAEDGASDAASVLGPSQPQELKLAYIKVKQTVVVPEPKGQQLFEALVQTYNRVNSWDSRRQMLSIMADTQSGRDSSPSAICHSVSLRSCIQITQLQVDHFLSFVMSPHVMQDLPFRETILKLSDGSKVQVPKVVTTRIRQEETTIHHCFERVLKDNMCLSC